MLRSWHIICVKEMLTTIMIIILCLSSYIWNTICASWVIFAWLYMSYMLYCPDFIFPTILIVLYSHHSLLATTSFFSIYCYIAWRSILYYRVWVQNFRSPQLRKDCGAPTSNTYPYTSQNKIVYFEMTRNPVTVTSHLQIRNMSFNWWN